MNGWIGFIAFGAGFIIAQVTKLLIDLIQGAIHHDKRTLGELIGDLTRSGGMPSGHAASMVAVSTYLGLTAGFDSGIFMLAGTVTLIIMYDAINVRQAVGEQGKALNGLLGQKKLRVVEGHTMSQVVVGAVIGVIVGMMIFCLSGQGGVA